MSNHFQNKLLKYEVDPPKTVWDNINSSLDEELMGMRKLYNFEQQPSPFIWDKLVNQLNADSASGKIIPFFKRYHKPLRYLGAASIITIVAITVALFVNKDAVSDELVYHPVSKENPTKLLKLNEDIPENNIKKTNDQNQDAANSFTKNSRYLTVANQKGNIVRLSQKALRVFNCAENIAAVNNSRCKENIQSLQQKMATSLVSPSGDFAGLIDMIKSLEENL
jgi:hypothetical protein